ncbi:MAG TPA: PAS domain S-box protein, partial [Candidatus Acidoferrum sp.]
MSELTPPANRAVATEHQRQKFSRRKTILSTGFGVVVSLLVASAALSHWHAAPGTANGVLLAMTGAAVLGGLWLWRATLREMSRQEQFTEQLQTAETALQGSEARLGSILGSATEAILCVDERQRIVLFNAAAEAVFGRTSEDMLGQKVDVLIPGRFRTEHVSHIRRFGETGVTRRRMGEFGHLSGVRANGEEFPIEASISQSTAGGQRYFTVILRDITERKRAEEALQQSEELFSKAFRNNPLAVKFTTETEGREIDVNDAFLEMTGYKREDVIGKTSTEIGFWVAPAERLKVVQEVRRT